MERSERTVNLGRQLSAEPSGADGRLGGAGGGRGRGRDAP